MKIGPSLLVATLALGLVGSTPEAAFSSDALGSAPWTLLSPKGGADLATASGNVLHVAIHHAVPAYYQTQLTHDITAGVPSGTTVRYHFWARSATKNPIHAVIEKRTAPYTRVLDKAITLTPTWKDYTFIVKVPSAYGPRGLAVRLQVGQQAGVVEFKGISATRG